MLFNTKSLTIVGALSVSLLGLAGCAATGTTDGTTGSTTPAAGSTAAALPAWAYSGANGPDKWGTLDPSYVTCVDGTAQSPIDISDPQTSDLENIVFNYTAGEAGVFNNGHTVEAEPMKEGVDSIVLDGETYPFLQFHFHAPSEHTVNGYPYPLEVHFVHKTEAGDIAVVGVFVQQGNENKAWAPFIKLISKATANPEDNLTELDWAAMLPGKQTTYRYDGSLTTPGCTEGVKWNVMTTPISMSPEQIDAFIGAYSNNARPVQPLNSRTVVKDSTK